MEYAWVRSFIFWVYVSTGSRNIQEKFCKFWDERESENSIITQDTTLIYIKLGTKSITVIFHRYLNLYLFQTYSKIQLWCIATRHFLGEKGTLLRQNTSLSYWNWQEWSFFQVSISSDFGGSQENKSGRDRRKVIHIKPQN